MRPHHRTSGFTLLEMLVVLAIAALIAGLAFPALDKSMKARAFRTAAVQIELAVRQAQASAIREDRTVRLEPFAQADARSAVALARGALPTDVRVDQPTSLRFFRDGTSSGGAIVIRSDAQAFTVTINPQTGVVTSQWS